MTKNVENQPLGQGGIKRKPLKMKKEKEKYSTNHSGSDGDKLEPVLCWGLYQLMLSLLSPNISSLTRRKWKKKRKSLEEEKNQYKLPWFRWEQTGTSALLGVVSTYVIVAFS